MWLSSFVAAIFGNPVDATCLLATVIPIMAGATNTLAAVIYVSHHQEHKILNIVQTEDEGNDLSALPSQKPTVDFTAI